MKSYVASISAILLLISCTHEFENEIERIPTVNDIRALLATVPEDTNTEITVMLYQKGRPIVPSLIDIMKDKKENISIRKHATVILGAIKDSRAIDPLIDCLQDSNCLIQRNAAFALMEITHQNFRRDANKWTTWWIENKPKYLSLIGDCNRPESQKGKNNHPCWVRDFIAREQFGPVANPPASISRCVYKDQTVYYLPPRCCDVPSVLFNGNGSYLCSPDGGLSGRGDGKCLDFFQQRSNCEVIWKDLRS